MAEVQQSLAARKTAQKRQAAAIFPLEVPGCRVNRSLPRNALESNRYSVYPSEIAPLISLAF
jgi:hypothetical protein